ncbi:hypothetical protein ACIBCN_38095 [Nocardia sp. NPDC051052]|uniref:hypothetical protein n=1 Tax=Nocardia sp. NPDC051052 TaxID=3364322 RepID=UPI0037A906D6
MSTSKSSVKRGIGSVVLASGVVFGVLAGSGTAAAESGPAVSSAVGTSAIADDGCTFSSVGGSCTDPGPVGGALIAFKNWLKTMGYGTGSSSGTAYFF